MTTREDLAAFLEELARRANDRSVRLENADTSSYVEAAGAWTGDLPGYFANRGEPLPMQPSWSLVASIFLAATVYE